MPHLPALRPTALALVIATSLLCTMPAAARCGTAAALTIGARLGTSSSMAPEDVTPRTKPILWLEPGLCVSLGRFELAGRYGHATTTTDYQAPSAAGRMRERAWTLDGAVSLAFPLSDRTETAVGVGFDYGHERIELAPTLLPAEVKVVERTLSLRLSATRWLGRGFALRGSVSPGLSWASLDNEFYDARFQRERTSCSLRLEAVWSPLHGAER